MKKYKTHLATINGDASLSDVINKKIHPEKNDENKQMWTLEFVVPCNKNDFMLIFYRFE